VYQPLSDVLPSERVVPDASGKSSLFSAPSRSQVSQFSHQMCFLPNLEERQSVMITVPLPAQDLDQLFSASACALFMICSLHPFPAEWDRVPSSALLFSSKFILTAASSFRTSARTRCLCDHELLSFLLNLLHKAAYALPSSVPRRDASPTFFSLPLLRDPFRLIIPPWVSSVFASPSPLLPGR